MSQTSDRSRPLAPVLVERAYADPEAVRALVGRHAPYWSIQRYVASESEFAAVSRQRDNGGTPALRVIPWFRGDWASGVPLVDGIEPILHNPVFIDAARKIFDAEVVRPILVYVNLMAPMPISGEGHIDVPAFRGMDRGKHPVWLLHSMGRSGLFRRWQIDQVTAVSWFYDGPGGSFDYWADGRDSPPSRVEDLTNRAVVGDNDFMFHRVDAIGSSPELPDGMSLDTELRIGPDGQWQIASGETVHEEHALGAIRVSVSWKAEVYPDAAAATLRDEHSDDLSLSRAIEIFRDDLASRGTPIEEPANPASDPAFIAAITETYPLPDLVYPTERETLKRAR